MMRRAEEERQAAVRLQSRCRGHQARRVSQERQAERRAKSMATVQRAEEEIREREDEMRAALRIQSQCRGRQARRVAANRRRTDKEQRATAHLRQEQGAAAVRIQATYR